MRDKLRVCSVVFVLVLGVSFFVSPVFGHVSANPASLNFGSVNVNTLSHPSNILLTNTSSRAAAIQKVFSSSAQFIVTGPVFPLMLPAHHSISFQVVFNPNAASVISATLTVTLVRQSVGSVVVPLTGTGVALPSPTYLLSHSASSLAFGSVSVGAAASQSITLSNTGNSNVVISQIAVTGSGFSVSGIVVPATLSAGHSASLLIAFSPTLAGSSAGSITIVSNATNSPATISVSGTGVQAEISVVPGNISFGSLTVGLTNTQTVTLSNHGNANLIVTQASVTGSGFADSGINLPLTMAPGNTSAFTVSFAPASAISSAGTLTLKSNASVPSLSVALSGTGIAQVRQLSANPASLSFGSLALHTSSSQTVTLTNTGNFAVTISQLNLTGAGFSHSGISLPITLAAGQSTSFNAIFDPTSAGSVSGAATVVSTASNSPESIALSGSGAAPVIHSISLSWQPSTSSVVGYYVYESSQAGGPFTRMNSSPCPVTTFSDTNVVSGDTYYFTTTAVDSSGMESAHSNQVAALVP